MTVTQNLDYNKALCIIYTSKQNVYWVKQTNLTKNADFLDNQRDSVKSKTHNLDSQSKNQN